MKRCLIALLLMVFLVFSISNIQAASAPKPTKTVAPVATPTPTPYYSFVGLYQCQLKVIDQALVKTVNIFDPYGDTGSLSFKGAYSLLIVLVEVTKNSSLPIKINTPDISLIADNEKNSGGKIFKCPCVGLRVLQDIPEELETVEIGIGSTNNFYGPLGIFYSDSNTFYLALLFDFDKGELPARMWISQPTDVIVPLDIDSSSSFDV